MAPAAETKVRPVFCASFAKFQFFLLFRLPLLLSRAKSSCLPQAQPLLTVFALFPSPRTRRSSPRPRTNSKPRSTTKSPAVCAALLRLLFLLCFPDRFCLVLPRHEGPHEQGLASGDVPTDRRLPRAQPSVGRCVRRRA